MSHRRVHSQGSIPFSWEDKPGVSKTPNHDDSIHIGSVDAAIHQKPTETAALAIEDKTIPLPPCLLQPPLRSTSGKAFFFRWQQDPFLVAYKECTKGDKLKSKALLRSANSKVKKSRSIFSCKTSTDAKEDHFMKLSRLPRLPRDKSRSLPSGDKHKLDFNYETWI